MTIDRAAFIAARKAKGWSQDDLAEKAGVSQATVGKIETGKALTSRALPELARILGTSVAALDTSFEAHVNAALEGGFKPPPSIVDVGSRIPVYASAEGGAGALIISSEAIDRVPRPFTLENVKDAYAILVEGESMDPAFEPGDIAWVNPLLGPRRNTDAIIYGFDDKVGESRALIKRVVTWTDSDWTLLQYNPRETFKLQRDPWRVCHRVVGKLSKR